MAFCIRFYSVVVKCSNVTVMVGQNRYSKLRILSQLHTLLFLNIHINVSVKKSFRWKNIE